MNKNRLLSHPAFLFALVAVLFVFFIRPWQNEYYYSLISWDKLGYYLYLPVAFIYKDWHTLSFVQEYFNNYQPSSYWYQSFAYDNGNQVFSYPIGIAILQAPFFFLGYLSALILGAPLDGFSMPFVFWIYLSGILYSNLGVYYSFKSLNYFFERKISYWALILMFIGTNLFYYCMIDTIMPHSYLFALYSLLIYYTIRWHKQQTFIRLVKIGVCIGVMVSVRATEVIAIIIPLFWGVHDIKSLEAKITLIQRNIFPMIVGVLVGSLPFVLQMIYWKLTTGHFIFNPYAHNHLGFNWLSPHLGNFLFSFRKGLFTYAPLLILALLGGLIVYRNSKFKEFKLPFILFLAINLYILSSWDIWWYGGSYGQRSMVQSYAILIFGFAAWLNWVLDKKVLKVFSWLFIVFCVLINVSFTWQQDHEIMNTDGITKGMFKESLVHPASGYIPSDARSEVKSWKKEYVQSERLFKTINLNNDPNTIKDSNGASITIAPYEFYELITLNTDSLIKSNGNWIRCAFEMKNNNVDPLQLNNIMIISEVKGYENDIRSWKSKSFNYLFKNKDDYNVWKKCEADFEIPKTFRTCDILHFYFWMNTNESAEIRNIKFYSLDLK